VLRPDLLLDAIGAHDPAVFECPERPFPFVHAPSGPGVYLAHFTAAFRSEFGISPGRLRARVHSARQLSSWLASRPSPLSTAIS